MGLRRLFSIIMMNERGIDYAITKKRRALSCSLSERMNHTVKYGPFKKMKFAKKSRWWASGSNGGMLLGVYEKEVLDALMKVPNKYDIFIDLGAADGYYSIGTLVSKKFRIGYSFEISAKGRESILKNATLNRVKKKLHIFGEAKKDFYLNIPKNDLKKSVILIDIEGAEFSILDKNTLSNLKNSIIFIELHEWFFDDGEKKLNKLKSDAKNFFKISELKTSSRDFSVFPELSLFNDSERWLIASEGRGRLMTWLRLDPI
jgi:hypothetical protein